MPRSVAVLASVVLTLALGATAPLAGAEPAVRDQITALAAQHNRTPVCAALLRRAAGKPVLKLRDRADAAKLSSAAPNSFEIIFRPAPSEWGHAHIRVGERVFDLGAPGFARDELSRLATWFPREEAYGFVFACDEGTRWRLQETYGDKVKKHRTGELKYQLKPWETPTPQGENCETFVASTLRKLVPGLGLYPEGRYAGAVGLAQWCLGSPRLAGITIYSSADEAAKDTFTLRRLE
jgi:hypothetical protein